VPSVTTALIPNGFTWESVRLAVLTEADLIGQHTGFAGGPADAEPPAGRHRPAPAQPR